MWIWSHKRIATPVVLPHNHYPDDASSFDDPSSKNYCFSVP